MKVKKAVSGGGPVWLHHDAVAKALGHTVHAEAFYRYRKYGLKGCNRYY